MLPSILLLDDEAEIINALKRLLQTHYQVHAFSRAEEALSFFCNNPTPIVISDIRMPVMDGITFLKKIVELNPRCRRIVLTGYLDIEEAKQAINEGQISCYLTKPWDNEELLAVLKHQLQVFRLENKKNATLKQLRINNQQLAVKQKSLANAVSNMQAEQEDGGSQVVKLKETNQQLLQFSANLVALYTNDDSGHNFRVAQQAKALAKRFQLEDSVCSHIYLAGLLYRVGIKSLPDDILALSVEQMSVQQTAMWQKFPLLSADILMEVELFKATAELVRHLLEHVDGSGPPDHLKDRAIPFGSRILSLVIYYDLLLQGKIVNRSVTPAEAQVLIEPMLDKAFQREVYHHLIAMLERPEASEEIEIPLSVTQLQVDMVLAHDINTHYQQKLLAENTRLQEKHLEGLLSYQKRTNKALVAYVKSSSLSASWFKQKRANED